MDEPDQPNDVAGLMTALAGMERSLGGRFSPLVRDVLSATGPAGGGVFGLLAWKQIEELSHSLRSVDFSPRYVPLHFVRPPYEVACYPIALADGVESAPIVIVADLRTGAPLGAVAYSIEAALDFRAQEFVSEAAFARGFVQLAAHALAREDNQGAYRRNKGGKLPKDHEWRIYRYCIQDVIVGATVVRYQPSGNCLEADVFLTAEIPELEELTGARALAQFLLGEAVRCGTSMEIRFTGNVEGGSVPVALRLLASRFGVPAGAVASDAMAPSESMALLFKLAGLQSSTVNRIAALAEAGEVAPEQLAYAVIEGSWSPHELAVLVSARAPSRVVAGSASRWDSLAFVEDQLVADAAVLAGRFTKALARTSAIFGSDPECGGESDAGEVDAARVEETEDAAIDLVTEMDGARLALLIAPLRDLDELVVVDSVGQHVARTRRLNVLLRPLTAGALPRQIEQDIAALREAPMDDGTTTVILVPRDFESVDRATRSILQERAAEAGAIIVMDSAPSAEIFTEARERMHRIAKRLRP